MFPRRKIQQLQSESARQIREETLFGRAVAKLYKKSFGIVKLAAHSDRNGFAAISVNSDDAFI